MASYSLSDELNDLCSTLEGLECPVGKDFNSFIKDEIMYYVLTHENTVAYKALSIILHKVSFDILKMFNTRYTSVTTEKVSNQQSVETFFTEMFGVCEDLDIVKKTNTINTGLLLYAMAIQYPKFDEFLQKYGIFPKQLLEGVKRVMDSSTDEPIKHTKKKKDKPIVVKQKLKTCSGETENNLKNLNQMAAEGKLNEVFGNDDVIHSCLRILLKKEHNNVILVGEEGVGKTDTVQHIANMIYNENCPKNFKDKILMKMDFSSLITGTALKGLFEQKFHSILKDAVSKGNYVFFIDNIDNVLSKRTHISETNIETLLEVLLCEPNIPVIATSRTKGFERIVRKTSVDRLFESVMLPECDKARTIEILKATKDKYEKFHNVVYDDEALETCVDIITKQGRGNLKLPSSAIEMIDEMGASITLAEEDTPEMQRLQQELNSIIGKKEIAKKSQHDYNKVDELTTMEIKLKSELSNLEKERMFNQKPVTLGKREVLDFLSNKFDMSVEELNDGEKQRLKRLSTDIKAKVIGQDEAVDEVCRAVRRQRVGLGEPERPTVLMFLGSTGTGKTYLAKQLANEIYGDEKYLVRLDMSEYADKTSVNKITGSANGYVGYEDETLLVREIKKKKNFVLLLDEFEKCNEEVHNVFLQIFDEGRFTDNHGTTYDMRDLIIIMTSNVGVAEADRRGKQIGFGKGDDNFSKSIIEKELKHKFKPEFLNRIQATVFFNRLSDENLRQIIAIEIGKLEKKVNKQGYTLDDEITKGKMVDNIYDTIIGKKEFGARPIVYEVQRQIEDLIVDYIIEHEIDKGHKFTYEQLINQC